MRKAIAILLGCVLTLAFSTARIGPAQAHVTQFQWLPPYISISGSQVVYEDDSTASLAVSVQNHMSVKMNVSKVVIEFYTMGKNKTLDVLTSPHQILPGHTEIFTVSFTAQVSEAIANMLHRYDIIVEHVNATGAKVGDFTYWWTVPYFVVYSSGQVDAMEAQMEYSAYYNKFASWSWQSAEALQKATQAEIEAMTGLMYLQRGEYAFATTQYNRAVTLYEEALTAELDYITTWSDAQLNVSLTQAAAAMKTADATLVEANAAMLEANATKVQADAAMTNAYGWYFIGIGFAIGWTLMGIGVIIYALRKPKPLA